MPLDVAGDEWAERHDDEPLPAHVFECGPCEAVAKAAALVGLVDLGVYEDDAVVSASVGGKADDPTFEPKLVSARLGGIDDLGLCQRGVRHESRPSCACRRRRACFPIAHTGRAQPA